MSDKISYEYAIVRVVPRVELDEFINAGVIVFAKQAKLLTAKTHLDEHRLRTLWPGVDVDSVRRHLAAIERVCAGDAEAGTIAKMSQSERFHWLVAPRSTVIQTSPVRTGITLQPELVAEVLARDLFATP